MARQITRRSRAQTLTRIGFSQPAAATAVSSSTAPVAGGRLTLSGTDPLPSADQLAATTLYYLPFEHGQISLWNGSAYALYTFTSASIALTGLTANTNYDAYAYQNSGTVTLELVAWTNDTTRATALTRNLGVLSKMGDVTRRYLGTIRITGTTGQCEDSDANRFVVNWFNRQGLQQTTVGTTDISTSSDTFTGTGTSRTLLILGTEVAVTAVLNHMTDATQDHFGGVDLAGTFKSTHWATSSQSAGGEAAFGMVAPGAYALTLQWRRASASGVARNSPATFPNQAHRVLAARGTWR
jgi:hypothetical protein